MKHEVSVFNSVAELYAKKYFDVAPYKETLDKLIKELNQGDHVCDLACGPCNLSYYISQNTKDLVITGIDLAQNMLEIAKQKFPLGNFILSDISSFKKKLKAQQDLFVCGFGIPYLSQQELTQMISDVADCLSANGLLYLSFMRGNDKMEKVYSNDDKTRFLLTNFHNINTVARIAKSKGFELIHKNQHEAPSKDVEMIFRLSH